MRCYLIRDTKVTVLQGVPKALPPDAKLIEAARQLDQNRFPAAVLVEIWNGLPGTTPVKKFKDRATGLRRLWQALEALPISSARTDSKQAQLIALLQRPGGASIEELSQAMGWQVHSVRGALSGVLKKRLGLAIESSTSDKGRVYRIAS